jgi:hypothetical protein
MDKQKNEMSFSLGRSYGIGFCFAIFIITSDLAIGVFMLFQAMRSHFEGMSIQNGIIGVLLFFILPIAALHGMLRRYPSSFSRTHISVEGLRCTAFGREIKRIGWNEITDCIAYIPNHYYIGGPIIIFSAHPIEEKDRIKVCEQNGMKNDMFFLPYNRSVLRALPKEYRPKRVYLTEERLPSPSIRGRFPHQSGDGSLS